MSAVVCPRTVISGAALNYRTWKNCSVIDGDLIIYRLDTDITELDLAFLKSIEWVYGEIVVQEAPGIFSLSFLRQIRIAHRAILRDNPNIIDALLPVIQQEDVVVLVENCPMLCPFNYPVPQSLGELRCYSPSMTFKANALLINDAVNATFQVRGKYFLIIPFPLYHYSGADTVYHTHTHTLTPSLTHLLIYAFHLCTQNSIFLLASNDSSSSSTSFFIPLNYSSVLARQLLTQIPVTIPQAKLTGLIVGKFCVYVCCVCVCVCICWVCFMRACFFFLFFFKLCKCLLICNYHYKIYSITDKPEVKAVMQAEGIVIQTTSSTAFALIRAIDTVGLDLHWLRTNNNGSLRTIAEQFSWTALQANKQGRIVYPAYALSPFLDYEYSVSTAQSGGNVLLTKRQEPIADPRLMLGYYSVGDGCNYQRIYWNFSSPLVASDWANISNLRLQVMVMEIITEIKTVFTGSFSIFDTAVLPDGIYKPSVLYWVTVYMDEPGPFRHHGSHFTKAFMTCAVVASSAPQIEQVALANETAMAFNVSWDCSRLSSYPSAVLLENYSFGCNGSAHKGSINSTSTAPRSSSSLGNNNNNNNSTHETILVPLSYSDVVITPTVCSARIVVANLMPHDHGVVDVAAALRFPSSTGSSGASPGANASPLSNITHAFKFLPAVQDPVLVLTAGCLEMQWPESPFAVLGYEIHVSTGLLHRRFTVPANNGTSVCLAIDDESLDERIVPAEHNEDSEATGSTVLGGRLQARYRVFSPAGQSEWSQWADAPVSAHAGGKRSSSSTTSLPVAALAGAVVGAVVGVAVAVFIGFKRLRKPERSHVERALIELKQFTTVVKPKLLSGKHIKVLQSIGEGKFGQVFKGVWRTPGMHVDATVAVKTLHDGFPEEATRAFATEACVMVSVIGRVVFFVVYYLLVYFCECVCVFCFD